MITELARVSSFAVDRGLAVASRWQRARRLLR